MRYSASMSPKPARESTEPPSARRRAPRNNGRRTTLRLPSELARTIADIAKLLGTTPNHALILCAERGATLYGREVEMARRAAAQSAAMDEALATADPGGEFPSPDEMRAAALFLRAGAD